MLSLENVQGCWKVIYHSSLLLPRDIKIVLLPICKLVVIHTVHLLIVQYSSIFFILYEN